MSEIVQTYGTKALGYERINLDHVAKFKPVKMNGCDRFNAFDCYTAEGRPLGIVSEHELAAAKQRQRFVVPETRGTMLIQFWLDTNGFVEAQRLPVIAWLISGDRTVEPVCCEDIDGSVWCLELSDVDAPYRWIFPDESIHESQQSAGDEAKRRLLKHTRTTDTAVSTLQETA